jgi:hypothetical protein
VLADFLVMYSRSHTVASKSLGTRTSFLVFHFEPKAKAISAKT